VIVPDVATLPTGLEVWMSFDGSKCARIPPVWRIQVVAEGQIDCFRTDVSEHTPVTEVLAGAARCFGWDLSILVLKADGKPLQLEENATVGSAALFGRKMTAVKQELHPVDMD